MNNFILNDFESIYYMKYILISLLAFVFCHCSRVIHDKNAVIVDLHEQTETSVFDVIDSVSVVALETSDSCLIASINRIRKKNDTLYIYDQRQSVLFCFNTDGDFLFRVFQKGNGPSEYQYIADFSISKCGDIYLLEPWGNIYHFDMNGVFQEKIVLPKVMKSYNEIYMIDDYVVIVSVWGDILFYSIENNVYKTYHLYDVMNTFSLLGRFYIYNNKIMMVSLFDNEIYNVTFDGIEFQWKWNFGNDNNHSKKIKKLIDTQVDYDPQGKESMLDYIGNNKLLNQFIYTSFESNRFNVALLEYENDFLHIFHDKKSNNNRVFKRTKENTIFHTCMYTDGVFLYYEQPFVENWRDLTCINKLILKEEELHKYRGKEDENPNIVIFNLKK